MNLKKYTVTDLAGPYVAGIQVPPDKIINLTDEQAYYESLNGTIKPVVADPEKAKKK